MEMTYGCIKLNIYTNLTVLLSLNGVAPRKFSSFATISALKRVSISTKQYFLAFAVIYK